MTKFLELHCADSRRALLIPVARILKVCTSSGGATFVQLADESIMVVEVFGTIKLMLTYAERFPDAIITVDEVMAAL